jgi:hypothetical protein
MPTRHPFRQDDSRQADERRVSRRRLFRDISGFNTLTEQLMASDLPGAAEKAWLEADFPNGSSTLAMETGDYAAASKYDRRT